jgi:hypothetical protein
MPERPAPWGADKWHRLTKVEWRPAFGLGEMKKSKRKGKNKRITPSSIVGMAIGLGLIAVGSYHAIILGNTGAYFVIFLGALFCAVIFLFYRG